MGAQLKFFGLLGKKVRHGYQNSLMRVRMNSMRNSVSVELETGSSSAWDPMMKKKSYFLAMVPAGLSIRHFPCSENQIGGKIFL